jgi:hypothetical protein
MSGGSAHLGREEETVKGGEIFSTDHRFYKRRREREVWAGPSGQRQNGPVNRWRVPESLALGG